MHWRGKASTIRRGGGDLSDTAITRLVLVPRQLRLLEELGSLQLDRSRLQSLQGAEHPTGHMVNASLNENSKLLSSKVRG